MTVKAYKVKRRQKNGVFWFWGESYTKLLPKVETFLKKQKYYFENYALKDYTN